MTHNELIQLYFERSNALQSLWTLYVVVIGGLLAFSSLRKQPDSITTAQVTILFAFFAYKNLDAIHDITLHRFEVLQAIRTSTPPGPGGLLATLLPPAYEGVRTFHVASDLLTIVTLWAMESRRKKNA